MHHTRVQLIRSVPNPYIMVRVGFGSARAMIGSITIYEQLVLAVWKILLYRAVAVATSLLTTPPPPLTPAVADFLARRWSR